MKNSIDVGATEGSEKSTLDKDYISILSKIESAFCEEMQKGEKKKVFKIKIGKDEAGNDEYKNFQLITADQLAEAKKREAKEREAKKQEGKEQEEKKRLLFEIGLNRFKLERNGNGEYLFPELEFLGETPNLVFFGEEIDKSTKDQEALDYTKKNVQELMREAIPKVEGIENEFDRLREVDGKFGGAPRPHRVIQL